jgi:hypothetical protein
MKFSVVALVAGCAVATSALAFDNPPVNPPNLAAFDNPPVNPPNRG